MQPAVPGAPPQPPQPDPAILEYQKKVSELQAAAQLLRDEKVRCFRIDIETDSTIAPDEDAEKQRRTEFIGAVGTFLKDAMPIVAQAPQLLPMAKEMFLFTVRGYRAGRMMEDVIERSIDALEKAMEQNAQAGPPPDPKVAQQAKEWEEAGKVKTLAEAKKIMAEAEAASVEAAMKPAEMQHEETMMQMEAQNAQLEHGLKAEETGLKRQQTHHDMQMQEKQHSFEREQGDADMQMRHTEMIMGHSQAKDANDLKRQQMRQKGGR
jgi:hypothetical protein